MANRLSNSPIGIFDSGIGGLTVAQAIVELLPNEDIIYFGDTAHLPYGDKSPDSIRYYALKICKYFIDSGCKAIVIACNSAASVAAYDILDFYGDDLLIINVVDPLVQEVAKSDFQKVGVIATTATTDSGVYPEQLKKYRPELEVESMATPLLVPMIEENIVHNEVSRIILKNYLEATPLMDIDALLLACTHYPLIKTEIADLLPKSVSILDSSKTTAEYLRKELQHRKLLNDNMNTPRSNLFKVSQFHPTFEKITALFFGNKVHLEEVDIWGEHQWPQEERRSGH